MKTLLKVIFYPIIAIFACTFISAIFSGVSELSEEMDKIEKTSGMELIKSYPIYHGVCNEIYKGKIEIYYSPKDSLYYSMSINGKLTPTYNKKEHMEFATSHWTKENIAKERAQSEECVAKREARAYKYNEEKRRRKEAHDVLDDLLDELN
jgi:hypothetical protein